MNIRWNFGVLLWLALAVPQSRFSVAFKLARVRTTPL
jgi:hypothetical protein